MRAILVALALLLGTPAMAAQPSDASLRELLTVTNAQKLIDGTMRQMDGAMQSAMQQATQGKQLTPEARAAMEEMQTKAVALTKAELSWDVLEPMFLEIYRSSLSQEEVDGMLEFYKSDAGKAVTAKMPTIMQNTMKAMQQRMMVLMPKLQQLQQDMMKKVSESKAKQ